MSLYDMIPTPPDMTEEEKKEKIDFMLKKLKDRINQRAIEELERRYIHHNFPSGGVFLKQENEDESGFVCRSEPFKIYPRILRTIPETKGSGVSIDLLGYMIHS